MRPADLIRRYHDDLDCLKRQDWPDLGRHVHDHVRHNDRDLGLDGYRAMLEKDFRAIPDLRFHAQTVSVQPPHIASRLHFDCHPQAMLFGLAVDGRRVLFAENVFYEYRDDLIWDMRSVIDKPAVADQL